LLRASVVHALLRATPMHARGLLCSFALAFAGCVSASRLTLDPPRNPVVGQSFTLDVSFAEGQATLCAPVPVGKGIFCGDVWHDTPGRIARVESIGCVGDGCIIDETVIQNGHLTVTLHGDREQDTTLQATVVLDDGREISESAAISFRTAQRTVIERPWHVYDEVGPCDGRIAVFPGARWSWRVAAEGSAAGVPLDSAPPTITVDNDAATATVSGLDLAPSTSPTQLFSSVPHGWDVALTAVHPGRAVVDIAIAGTHQAVAIRVASASEIVGASLRKDHTQERADVAPLGDDSLPLADVSEIVAASVAPGKQQRFLIALELSDGTLAYGGAGFVDTDRPFEAVSARSYTDLEPTAADKLAAQTLLVTVPAGTTGALHFDYQTLHTSFTLVGAAK
jgi:hypothetical protein